MRNSQIIFEQIKNIIVSSASTLEPEGYLYLLENVQEEVEARIAAFKDDKRRRELEERETRDTR